MGHTKAHETTLGISLFPILNTAAGVENCISFRKLKLHCRTGEIVSLWNIKPRQTQLNACRLTD